MPDSDKTAIKQVVILDKSAGATSAALDYSASGVLQRAAREGLGGYIDYTLAQQLAALGRGAVDRWFQTTHASLSGGGVLSPAPVQEPAPSDEGFIIGGNRGGLFGSGTISTEILLLAGVGGLLFFLQLKK